MAKNGWKTCGHCEGSGVCKNKLKGFQTIFWFIPFPIKVSDASCLMAEGIDPTKSDAIVKCSVCNGTGFVYLDQNGEKRIPMPKN
jgi:DnaJ-class molecular chaperone